MRFTLCHSSQARLVSSAGKQGKTELAVREESEKQLTLAGTGGQGQ